MSLTIRPARPEEYDALGDLIVAAYLTVRDELGPYELQLRDAKGRAEHAELLVAVDDAGRLLGTVTNVPDGGAWGEIAEPGEAEFRMLAVAPEYGGRGVGRALVEHCVADARRRGRTAIVLSSSPTMTVAHRIYQALGFRRTPERDWTPAPGIDLLTYRLDL